MAKPTRFTPKNSPHGWRINIPAKYSQTGKRQQLFYRTQKLALAAAEDLKQKKDDFGQQTRAISPSLAEKAFAAANLLAPYGVDLLEAARIVADMREKEAASKPLAAAIDEWLLECEVLRAKTQKNYRQTANLLKEAFGDRLLTSLTKDQLQNVLAPSMGMPRITAESHVTRGRAFWRWAADKGWCNKKTFDGVKPPKAPATPSDISILSLSEVKTLLQVAQKYFPASVATYALQLFAGIRVEEVARLEAHHVSVEGIELPASVTKKGRRRHITPNETLAAWLAEYPFQPCPNWKRVDRAVRYLAGWDLAPDPDLVKPDWLQKDNGPRPDWPQNGIRHSHASYAVANGASIDNLLFEFGHTSKPDTLRSHYVGRASKRQAAAFFAIRPGYDEPKENHGTK